MKFFSESESDVINKLNVLIDKFNLFIENQPPRVYNNDSLAAYLGVSKAVLKKYREDGLIGFSRVGNQIFYKQSDIDKFLNDTRTYVYR